MHIEDLELDDFDAVGAAAQLLVDGFRGISPSWPNLDTALATVVEALEDDCLVRIARADDGAVVGWIGGIPDYDGRVWEVHPLVVAPDRQREGIGRALLADLEALVAGQGGLTLWLGADDEAGRTSLGGVDPYPDLLGALAAIRDLGGHPFEFYRRCGFARRHRAGRERAGAAGHPDGKAGRAASDLTRQPSGVRNFT